MSEPISIRRIIERLTDGTIRIPGFQRKFVWEPERAALLMDSLYKGYPVGSVLLWRTHSRLRRENYLGAFELPEPDREYPVDYVLDGQQRLTSVFTTFQTSLVPSSEDPEVWMPIFYDFSTEEDAQQSRFVALPQVEKTEDHFPLKVFLDAGAFSRETRGLSESRNEEIARVQQRFLETLLPVETFESEDRASVAIVFERVNRMGVELDIFQLLTAWTWSDDFDLQQRFSDLSEEFEYFGFEDVGLDSELLLRCTAAVLREDPLPTALVDVSGSEVRDNFDLVANSIRRAIDFVRTNFLIRHVKLMPYTSLLIPLATFFAHRTNASVTAEERTVLETWFWRACFSHRYSGNPQRNIRRDIREASRLRSGEESVLGQISDDFDGSSYFRKRFNISTVASKTYILMLARSHPKTFISGELVELEQVLSEPNRSEFHHCYPRAHLESLGLATREIDVLANIAMINRSENREISDKAPSEYRGLMASNVEDVLSSSLIPSNLFDDVYEAFLSARVEMLTANANVLMRSADI